MVLPQVVAEAVVPTTLDLMQEHMVVAAVPVMMIVLEVVVLEVLVPLELFGDQVGLIHQHSQQIKVRVQ